MPRRQRIADQMEADEYVSCYFPRTGAFFNLQGLVVRGEDASGCQTTNAALFPAFHALNCPRLRDALPGEVPPQGEAALVVVDDEVLAACPVLSTSGGAPIPKVAFGGCSRHGPFGCCCTFVRRVVWCFHHVLDEFGASAPLGPPSEEDGATSSPTRSGHRARFLPAAALMSTRVADVLVEWGAGEARDGLTLIQTGQPLPAFIAVLDDDGSRLVLALLHTGVPLSAARRVFEVRSVKNLNLALLKQLVSEAGVPVDLPGSPSPRRRELDLPECVGCTPSALAGSCADVGRCQHCQSWLCASCSVPCSLCRSSCCPQCFVVKSSLASGALDSTAPPVTLCVSCL